MRAKEVVATMADQSNMSIQQPREFVYLDDESIDGHLSSLGVGLQVGATEKTIDEQESQSRFAALVPIGPGAFGGEKGNRTRDENTTESQMDITVPYRFQELVRQIGTNSIKNPEKESVEYGDVVSVTGSVSPMSLYRFEITTGAIETMSVETQRAMKAIEGAPEVDTQEAEATEAFLQLARNITGERVPLRIDTKDNSYGTVLKRDRLRVPQSHAFAQKRKYTLFGRVEEVVEEDSHWNPIDLLRLADAFSDGDLGIGEFNEMLKSVAKEQEVTMTDDHISISGPTKIIYPIAMYW